MRFALLLWLAAFAVVFVSTLLVLRRRLDWRRLVVPYIPYLFIIVAACYGYLAARAARERVLNSAASLAVTASFLLFGIRELVRQKKASGTEPAGDKAGADAPRSVPAVAD